MFKRVCVGALVAAACIASARTARAGLTVQASEVIIDDTPLDAFHRDLTRTRQTDQGYLDVETDDSIIIADNSVDANFGILSTKTVRFSHRLDWLDPAPAGYQSAMLTITAFGPLGGDDIVFADTFALGSLTPATRLPFITSTVFSASGGEANFFLSDGVLHVKVDKNEGAGFLGSLNAISVFRSELSVVYDAQGGAPGGDGAVDGAATPEPAAAAVWGLLALCGCVFWRNQRRT